MVTIVLLLLTLIVLWTLGLMFLLLCSAAAADGGCGGADGVAAAGTDDAVVFAVLLLLVLMLLREERWTPRPRRHVSFGRRGSLPCPTANSVANGVVGYSPDCLKCVGCSLMACCWPYSLNSTELLAVASAAICVAVSLAAYRFDGVCVDSCSFAAGCIVGCSLPPSMWLESSRCRLW